MHAQERKLSFNTAEKSDLYNFDKCSFEGKSESSLEEVLCQATFFLKLPFNHKDSKETWKLLNPPICRLCVLGNC